MKLTDTEILDGLALCEAATPGLWESNVWIDTNGSEWRATGPGHESEDPYADSEPGGPDEQAAQRDAAFIVGASALLKRALAELQAARGEVGRLTERRDALLLLVRQLSSSVPYEEEAGNVATLIAEVGTLRSSERTLRAEVDRLRGLEGK